MDDIPRSHTLKTWTLEWNAVACGMKSFEVRRNDRHFQVGDVLFLECFDPETYQIIRDDDGAPLTVFADVSYVLAGGQFGIERGFVVMGLSNVRSTLRRL